MIDEKRCPSYSTVFFLFAVLYGLLWNKQNKDKDKERLLFLLNISRIT